MKKQKLEKSITPPARGKDYLEQQTTKMRTPGNVTPALINHLAEKFSPEFIAGKIEELLNATHLTKGGQAISDNRAREAGLKLLMSYLIGLPVQRQEILQLNFDSLEELQKRAQQSPTIQAAVARVLAPTNIQSDGPLESSLEDSK